MKKSTSQQTRVHRGFGIVIVDHHFTGQPVSSLWLVLYVSVRVEENCSAMFLFWRFFLCLSLLVVSKCQDWVIDDEGCRTPQGGVGNCLPIRQCQPMVEALKAAGKTISERVRQQMNSYVCSFNNGVVHVCCPSGPIVFQYDSPVGQSETPPDVSNHRNVYLLPEDCGYLDDGNKIRNGRDAEINEFPWMALLSYRTMRGPQFKCGATIINSRYILTAAHCIKNLESPLLGVRIGEYNIRTKTDCGTLQDGSMKCTEGVQDLAIEEIIPHPQFNASIIINDIGLIRVSPMNLNVENARAVCLPLGELRTEVFQNVVVTGWGVTNIQNGQTSDILQKVNLPVMDSEQCRNVYRNQSRALITAKQVCAGGKDKKDSCPGDSGGPLHTAAYHNDATRYIQQGIVSFGPRECGLDGYPGVYTRVAYYMDWILDTIRP